MGGCPPMVSRNLGPCQGRCLSSVVARIMWCFTDHMAQGAESSARLKEHIERHRALVGSVVAVGATCLAVLWLVIVPEKAATTTGLQALTIRYAHSLCWALLAAAAGTYAVRAPAHTTRTLTWAALGAYAAFLTALFL